MTFQQLAAVVVAVVCITVPLQAAEPSLPFCVVDTGQKLIFSDSGQLLEVPKPGEPFFGQDAQYRSHPPSYALNSDGLTVYDRNSGLTWQRNPDTNGDGCLDQRDKLTLSQAKARPAALNAARFGGYSDWRLPSIKELYSLIDFSGIDPSGMAGTDTSGLRAFIDTEYFRFAYGDPNGGFPERIIDSQYASCTLYVPKTWRGFDKLFGVNFADGRIKGYDLTMPDGVQQKRFFVQCVRGNTRYGINDFQDNGNQSITDRSTGLMWSQEDSRQGLNWQAALAWVQARNEESYLGYHDWRLPNAKELQSIVDYARSPDTTGSAAIDPLFRCTQITNEADQLDYPCYWTATTHSAAGRAAVYVSFGRAMGYMMGAWHDVHGAGAQRSDPKAGNRVSFPYGRGPQGDAIRISNFVRLVRSVDPQSVRPVEPDVTPIASWHRDGSPDFPQRFPPPYSGGPPAGSFHLIPPFAAEQLNLSPDQLRRIDELAKETKAKLDKILTPTQQKRLEDWRPPRPDGPGGGRPRPGRGGPEGRF